MASLPNSSKTQPPAARPSSRRDTATQNAPTYTVPNTNIAAVEIPAVVQNIERAISAFGRVSSFDHVSYVFLSGYALLTAVVGNGPSTQLTAPLSQPREPILQPDHVS